LAVPLAPQGREEESGRENPRRKRKKTERALQLCCFDHRKKHPRTSKDQRSTSKKERGGKLPSFNLKIPNRRDEQKREQKTRREILEKEIHEQKSATSQKKREGRDEVGS